MGLTPSQQVIAKLGVQAKGFAKAIGALSDSRYLREAARAVIPDGFALLEETGEVVIYEVADTHPIRPEKAQKLAELSDELDDIGWTLRVVVMDYTGHVTADLPGWAFMPAYTDMFAPENCLDMTPAAMAVARDRPTMPPATLEQLLEVMNKLPL